jgi:putative copper resistance protein D
LDAVSIGLIGCRFVHYVTLMSLFGALLFPLYAGGAAAIARPAATTRGLIAASLLAILSGLGWFAFTSAGMAGALSGAWDPATLRSVFEDTGFGPLWLCRIVGLVMVAALVATARTGARTLAVATSAAALVSLAWTGHANASEGAPGLARRAADAAHLFSAGLWIGALPMLAARLQANADAGAVFVVISRFSRVAVPAVALLVLSGVVNAAMILSAPRDLLTTEYGRWLGFKLGLVAAMLWLAAFNRRRLTPALRDGSAPAQRRLRLHTLIELALGIAVLGVVAVLGTLSPT